MVSGFKDSPIASIPQAPDDVLHTRLPRVIQDTVEREFQQFLGAAPFGGTPARPSIAP